MALVQHQVSESGLDSNTVLKASLALIQRIQTLQDENRVDKPSLLVDDDEENKNSQLDVPLWLNITAKTHVATSNSLKPGKVTVPNVLYSMPNTRVCLITADPPASNPTAYKDALADSAFPKDVKRMISKVVSYSKVAKKYKSYESRRKFLADYDVFLADERIIKLLPVTLGKTFYKSQTKRPIPVSLTGKEKWGKREKKTALDRLKPKPHNSAVSGPEEVGKPEDMAADIEKALSVVTVNLSPSASLHIKVAYAGWPAEYITANVEAVVNTVVDKWVPGKWSGVKSITIKGPETASLPIYVAEEEWADEDYVLDGGEQDPELGFQKKSREAKKELKKQKKLARRLAEEDLENQDELQSLLESTTLTKKRKRDDQAVKDVAEPAKEKKTKKKKVEVVADKVPAKRKVTRAKDLRQS